MEVRRLNGECDDLDTCAAFFDTDAEVVLVQGTKVTDPSTLAQTRPGPDEGLLAVPRHVFEEAVARLRARP